MKMRLLSILLAGASLALLVSLSACQGQESPPLSEVPEGPSATLPSPHPGQFLTFFIRPDGGSAQECTGLVDAPYAGTGMGQDCAWNHPFQALPPDGTPRIAGGDTLIIGAGSYLMGYGAPGADNCVYEASFGCHMTPIPSGPDAGHPTRILGAGWDSGCADPPELWGSGRPWFVVNMTDSSNIDAFCLEITDHSSCIEDHLFPTGGSPYTCQRDTPPYGDWAAAGLYSEDSSNVHLQDLNIHGLANSGVVAGRLTDWTIDNVRIVGNGQAGWNGDLIGDGTNSENYGTMIFRHLAVDWNGCGETYPGEEHDGCWGQIAGGYGDGMGMGTTGGHWIFEDSQFLYNTSDGLDLLYARLPGVVVEIRRTLAVGNDGNQIKFTASQAVIENTIIISNCGFFHGMPSWNNEDDCRAGGDALALALQPGGQFSVVNSTISGEGVCLVIAECAYEQTCNGSEQVLMRNTIFQGQTRFYDPEDVSCFAWFDDESDPPMPANPIVVDYSIINRVKFGNVLPCPGDHNLCDIPSGLANISMDDFDAHLVAGSQAIDAGSTEGAPGDDFTGTPRDARPDIGAYEY